MLRVNLLKKIMHRCNIHPCAWLDSWLTYPRYLGTIKPKLLEDSEQEYITRRMSMQNGWWYKEISVPIGKKIMAISPHPDDEAIGAGGLLLAHSRLSEIHLVAICSTESAEMLECSSVKNCDSYRLELVHKRKQEFLKTAQMLNAKSYYHLDFSESNIPASFEAAAKLRSIVDEIKPDVILLPWLFDNNPDHRMANVLHAWGCADYKCVVFGYEVWTLLQPNAVLDISDYIEDKLNLIRNYESQIKDNDYLSYVKGLASMRSFQQPVRGNRDGAVEAYLALPSHEYCSLVHHFYGPPGSIKESTRKLLGLK